MKKKIINGILMVALLAATTTSFVSCKDNDEDVKTDLIAQLNQKAIDLRAAWQQDDATLSSNLTTAYQNADAAVKQAAKDYTDEREQAVKDWVADQGYLKKTEFPTVLADELVKNQDFIDLKDKLDTAADDIATLQDDMAAAQGDIQDLQDVVNDPEKGIDAINDRLDEIEDALEKLTEDFKNLITSVNVNATSSTILANSKVFPGVDMQFLGAAYGKPAAAKGAFPSKETGLSDDALAGVTDLKGYYDWEDGALINNQEDEFNAGKIFFTVNPSNITKEALNNTVKLTLVNSLQKEIFEIGDVTESKEALSWGITRAENDAQLWEAPVKYDAKSIDAIELQNIIDFSALKENVKNIINDAKSAEATKASAKSTTKAVLKETAKIVANLLNAKLPAMPAVALKATWEDNTVGTRSVLSDYSIAATAYKPLGFNEFNGVSFGKDVNLTKIDNLFKKIIDKVMSKVDGINLDGLKIGTITGVNYNDYNKSKTIWIKVSQNQTAPYATTIDLAVTDEGAAAPAGFVAAPAPADPVVTITSANVDADMSGALETLIDTKVNGTLTSANTAIQDVIDQVKNIIQKADNAADKAKTLEARVTDYLESYIKRTINFVSNGRFLEPILLVDTKAGLRRATGTYKADTYHFVPTTMNYELIAPAFKKYIAVLDKNGKVISGSQKILTKGDSNFANVEVELTTDAAQIVYAAMDFKGNQVAKVYNVTVE